MKKILKLILVIVLTIVITVIVGVTIVVKTFKMDRLKPRILAESSHLLGRPLNFKDMGLGFSLKEGLSLHLKGLTVEDDPDFGKGDFLKVEDLSFRLDVGKLLMKRQLVILKVEIQSPELTVIRDKEGRINLESLGKPSPRVAAREIFRSPPVFGPSEALALPEDEIIPSFLIQAILVKNGSIHFIDRSWEPELALSFSRLDLKIHHFSLSAPFGFSVEGALFSDQKNFQSEGKAHVLGTGGQFQLSDVRIATNLSQLSLEKLRGSFPLLREVPFPSAVNGKIQGTIKNLELGPQGLKDISAEGELQGGSLSFKEISPGISFMISQIDLKLKNLSLSSPFEWTARAALFSDQPDIFLKGQGRFDPQIGNIQLKDTNISADLALISLPQLKSSVSILKNFTSLESLAGKFDATFEMNVSSKGPAFVSGQGELKDGMIKLKECLLPFESIHSRFQISGSQIHIPEFSFKIGRGAFHAQGKVDDYLGTQDFTGEFDLKDVDLGQTMDQTGMPVKIQGILEGKFRAEGQGFKPEALARSLSAEGNLEIKEGRLKDINILKIILGKISMIPNLVDKIEAALPPRYQEQLTQKDTLLRQVHFTTIVHQGLLVIQSATLDADGFLLTGQGQVDFNQQFSLNGSFFIPEDLSASMMSVVPEFEYLLDEQKRILIPGLKLSGKIPRVENFSIDAEYLARKMIINKGKSELEKVLDKANPPQRQLLEGILDSIFK